MLNDVLRAPLLQAANNRQLRHLVETAPVSRSVVRRFVAGETEDDGLRAARDLTGGGLQVSLDRLGEDTTDRQDADEVREAYVALLRRLSDAGLTAGGRVEVSLKLSAVGQALGADGPRISTELAHGVCEAARDAGTTVTLDMEDYTTTDDTLASLVDLRRDFPTTGGVVQAYLHRTEADCTDLAGEGSRVRLCKGAYDQPESVAYQAKADVDKSYVRCLKTLMAGHGYPMVATHDPRLVDIAGALAVQHEREQGSYEYQMLYGIRPDEQKRLASTGETVRVYTPYGSEWWGYLVRRMAERPANAGFFLRAVATRG